MLNWLLYVLYFVVYLSFNPFQEPIFNPCNPLRQTDDGKQNQYQNIALGYVRLGNLDLDFENPDFGFAIEREIRKRISTLRYLFLDFVGISLKGNELELWLASLTTCNFITVQINR